MTLRSFVVPTAVPFRVLARGLAAAAVAVLASACGPAEAPKRGAPPPVPVSVGSVEVKAMDVSFHAIGHVEPIETVAVKARIGGELQAIHFSEGQTVAVGARLFTIDPRPAQAALAQAEAVLARDQAQLVKAEADVARYRDLVAQDFVTREQFDQMTATAAALTAAVAADRANVNAARLNLEYSTVLAPVSGRTGSLEVRVGALVKANDDRPMVTVNRIRPIYATFSVPAQLLPEVVRRRGDGIRVVATVPGAAAAVTDGQLSFVDNAVDPATGTIRLKATFANADETLWPGQFVDLEVILGTEPDRVVCPAAAVRSGQSGQFVFVVSAAGTVEQRSIEVARAGERDAVIAAGRSGGETVVTDGQIRLVDGAAVVVKEAVGGGNAS